MKEQKETIGFVLQESGLSDNSGFYLGRTIEYGDINANILCTVSKNIKKYIGLEEQKVFNQMVLDLPTLKASFLIDFTIHLQIAGIEDGWWWNKERFFNHYNPEALKMPVCKETERIKLEFKKMMNLD